MSATRFELDEAKAAEWLAEQLAKYEAFNNGDGDEAPEVDIDAEWSPIWHDDYGSDTGNLVSAAQYAGAIAKPDHAQVEYDYYNSEGDSGYSWQVYVDGPVSLKLSTYMSKMRSLCDDDDRGAEAAMWILRGAVAGGNQLLDDLDAYVASRTEAGQ